MREDKQLLVLTHLSQLLDLVTVIGGFIVPLVIWLTQKDKIFGMDAHGKMILNFQISIFIYSIFCNSIDPIIWIRVYSVNWYWYRGYPFPDLKCY